MSNSTKQTNLNEETKTFQNSNLILEDRKLLKITGVEKVFETNENKVCINVSGSLLNILGQ